MGDCQKYPGLCLRWRHAAGWYIWIWDDIEVLVCYVYTNSGLVAVGGMLKN